MTVNLSAPFQNTIIVCLRQLIYICTSISQTASESWLLLTVKVYVLMPDSKLRWMCWLNAVATDYIILCNVDIWINQKFKPPKKRILEEKRTFRLPDLMPETPVWPPTTGRPTTSTAQKHCTPGNTALRLLVVPLPAIPLFSFQVWCLLSWLYTSNEMFLILFS